MGTGKIILLVVGAIIILISFGLVVGGGGVLWANEALTDDDGYYMTDSLHMEKDSYAIISEPADVELEGAWAFDWGDLATFKGEVESGNVDKNIFVGVASEDDLTEYLRNVEHDMVTDFEIDPEEWEYENVPGTAEPAPPTSQTFWEESAYGAGTQVLEWELEEGTWIFVMMNEDGSAGIDLDMELGAKVEWLVGVGVGLLAGGIIGLIVGGVMFFFALRKSRETVPTAPVASSTPDSP